MIKRINSFGIRGVEDLLRKERKDSSGAITKGANLTDEQVSVILDFLKTENLEELKKKLKNPLSQDELKN